MTSSRFSFETLTAGIACCGAAVLFAWSVTGCANRHLPPPLTADPEPTDGITASRPVPPKFEVTDRVALNTSMGTIVLGLYGKEAPITVKNFLEYVDSGFYNGTIFHRIIAGFMIQGGGFDKDLDRAATREPIRLELVPGLEHTPGVISMARTPSDIHSATSQFFISVSMAPQLNGSYAAFGKVEEGEDILFAISGVPTHNVETGSGAMADVPVEPVTIDSITRL